LWTGERKGLGLYYKALHLSECYIDEDFAGRVDTVHRKYELSARQCLQEFGADALTGKMREAVTRNKLDDKFEILHIVCPNGDLQPDALDRRSMAIDSITIAIADKVILRRKGYHSMPISVSRHVTGPGDIYGRSPAIKVLPTIKGLNQMAQTILRSAHKMVDPALA
ncbi:portal protein, partial [Pseudomonas proteolytica]|uniref:portal protein n=1 Tax=Pseudomonas proteolytica TaxID=219574 RepID=UPI0030DC9EC4